MGRSKFPGKPSKSINRKRISVLQLDSNSTNTSGAEAASSTVNAAQSHSSSSAGSAAATAGGGNSSTATSQTNSEDEEATQTKTKEKNGEYVGELRADKHKNGKREDDEDDEQPPPASAATTNTTVGGNGSIRQTNTTNQQQQQQQQQQQNNNNSNSQQHSQHGGGKPQQQNSTQAKILGPTLSAKVVTTTTTTPAATTTTKPNNSNNHNKHTRKPGHNKQDTTNNVIQTVENNKSKTKNEINEQPEKQHEIVDDVEYAGEEDEMEEEEEKHEDEEQQHNLRSPLQHCAQTLKFPQRNCKKFKNLNIHKPEVMLPSSTKLKLQQETSCNIKTVATTPASQQQQTLTTATETSAISTTTTTAMPTVFSPKTNEAEAVNNTTEQKNQTKPPQTCEMSSSSSAAAAISSTATACTSSTKQRLNHTKHNDNDAATPPTHKIAADDDDQHLQHNDHNAQERLNAEQHGNNDDDVAVDDNHDAVHHTEEHNNDDVVGNSSSSHNDLITNPNSPAINSVTACSTSETNCSDLQENDCNSGTKETTSLIATTMALDTKLTSDGATTSSTSSSSSGTTDKKQKKTVTFKNVLETSDDKCAVKKFYNPDNRKPLISIIKKECLNRPLMYTRSSECIVRPSRLTEILKNNSNIDKLNSLKFRSNNVGERSSTTSVLAGPLSRVFGAPCEDETQQQKQNLISFRLSKEVSDDEEEDVDEEAEEEDDDDDEEDDDDDDEEEEDVEDEAADEAGPEDDVLDDSLENGLKKETLNVIKMDDKLRVEEKNEDEQQMIVDTNFVLPKRSCRSSKMIKPNKRLLEDNTICKKSSLKSLINASTISATGPVVKDEKPIANYFGLGDFKAKDCNGLTNGKSAATKDPMTLESTKPSAFAAATSNVFSNFGLNAVNGIGGTSNNSLSSASSKPSSFILRQPRLQFESLSAATSNSSATTTSDRNNATATAAAALALSASLPKSLLHAISSSASTTATLPALSPSATVTAAVSTFSLNGTSALKNNVTTTPISSVSPSSIILCVVCSSTIHSKNLPQASKYGQLSCEYCRKFISKIAKKSLAIKNSTNNKPIIAQCKADGNCTILPSNKGIHIKNFKKLYKERCGLCWLKKCMQTLQLPKMRLNALLPVFNAVIGNKSQLVETKIRKDLELLEATKHSIKWKVNMEANTTPTLLISAKPVEGLKLNLKSNSLTENNATFGSSPLLRPAILEKPIYMKPALEAKQEFVEKPEKKPLEILKDFKLEAMSVDVTMGTTTSKPRRKDKLLQEKERKEVKLKELHSPKSEEKVKDSKEQLEKLEVLEETPSEQKQETAVGNGTIPLNNSIATAVATTAITNSTASPAVTSASASVPADKRQRIDLKGPRVKHVCRSASIVLGQPLAMFGEDEENPTLTAEELQHSLENCAEKQTLTDENDNCASCKPQQPQTVVNAEDTICRESPPLKAAKVDNNNSTKSLPPPSKLSQRPHHYNTQLTAYKKQFSSQMVATASSALMPQKRKEPQLKCKLLISIDFWENYDPAEVCQTGFGLIITETVAQRALCFLCGSAGQDPLIFCACCCEPYHQYCVQDEFNLKHGSLDDTLLLNESCLSITGLTSNTAIAKLNWLCPRCTVCYTCNMSSGAKVKCQKCQKNYHSTCLGTSKRLLGADRPLICVNCLKCRSCSTTKVTKFVGNLPMCTNCFKLRKKGNYCPVCQKCYDDQDFDLKMMECGDCHQWVHAKCETLTDEQYNLLSTLPESIEFICKRCSRKSTEAKERATEWREAVKEEFKSNLMSVLKLLSKSRQACSLLRLSPRKQMKCSCGSASNSLTTTKYQPKSLQFNQDPSSQSSSAVDVYEFDDQEKDIEIPTQPLSMEKKCVCQAATQSSSNHLSLVEIKQKITNGTYGSLAEFNYDMTLVIQLANCDDLVIVYKEIVSEQFPWFQNETQACTDALEEDMYESAGGAYGLNTSLDSESDYQMDCMPSAADHQLEAERSALLAELPADLEDQLYNIKTRQDSRICLFCRRGGEGLAHEESRLLYCGHDCWVHINCALWSAEVFEEIDGSLQNVHSAVARGRMIKCSVCGNRGATVGCNVKSCGEHYHYPCARSKNCAFLADKSMYCTAHAPSAQNSKVCFETHFDVMRPVYVELERKRKKLVEPAKVQFHIGSLEVRQLGHVIPRFSDSYEAVVPVNFLCSRLYWSMKEPWKIVEYTVRTFIQNSNNAILSGACLDLGKHFTVDHAQSNGTMIQLGLQQIQQWHTSLSRGDYDALEEYEYLNSFPNNATCSQTTTQETAGTNDEEPQTNADLLPPEIKEAIFEDLPGDLLDGISMLDIFTKSMNYEDMAQSEQSQTPLTDEDTMISIGAFTKQLTAEINNGWPNNANVAAMEDALLSNRQKLKKSSSPVINCDANAKNAIKRRKISENMLISLNQHQRSQKKDCASASRRLDLESTTKRTFTWSAEKRYNLEAPSNVAAPNDKLRIMQMDGVDDSITEYRFITQDNSSHQTPAIKCERCQCTYRNLETFQRHMATCQHNSGASDASNANHNGEVTINGISLEQLQELNKLQQQQQQQHQQQQQQRTHQLPFLQAIPTQTLNHLQGLSTANIQTMPLQLQGVQNLQNLQQLQQLQQLTQPQTLGGNFFISTAQPEVQNTISDLQLYANALQGLTANANGTFTLQPTANTYTTTTTQQMTQNQPQLLALSTNADGTQQIIQLPAQTSTPSATGTYQTLQATNSDKKIILPVGGGKPMKTMATKAAQQAAAKNKLKQASAVKPIQSKINVASSNQMSAPQTVTATQLLNQQLLQQLQQAQAQQNAQTPQIVFQSAAAPQQQPQLIMQQPQNIISFLTTTNDGTQQPQLQYVTLPTAQNNHGQTQHGQTLFTTAGNGQPLMQSAYLQTDASGNLVLTNAPHQATTPLHLLTSSHQSQPQVIGTLIQPQTLQLQGGNVITTSNDGGLTQTTAPQGQQQVILTNGGGGEMQPQMILATNTPPMYYGLETIVQNTVMSSQQFVSTAMPGVLSQNASFSATTTQVFQASKIEPLVDIPAGYVLLNNVDANNAATILQQQPQQQTTSTNQGAQTNQANFIQAALQQQAAAAAAASLAEQQQQQQHQQQQQSHNNVYRIQTPPVSTAQGFQLTPQIVVAQAQQQHQQQQQSNAAASSQHATQYLDTNTGTVYSAKVAPVAQVKRSKATPVATVTKVQPQVVNKVIPNVAQVQQPSAAKPKQSTQSQQNCTKTNTSMATATSQNQQHQMAATQAQSAASPGQATLTTNLKQQNCEVNSNTVANQQNSVTGNKKTNMIRPLNKVEVKPKVMKTAAATVVTKSTPVTPVVNNIASNGDNTNAYKMLNVKSQQQQPHLQNPPQQHPIQQQQTLPSSNESTLPTHAQPLQSPLEVQDNALLTINNLAENNLNPEFINLQHVANNHQQHYNVSDALLLDENLEMTPQAPLSHCSYSSNTGNYENNQQPQQQQQGQSQQPTTMANENVSNILPTIQRMPQYTNINIVNPLQQYSAASNTLATSNSTTVSTAVTRPTNRVLPMQQKTYEQHNTTCTTHTASLTTTTAYCASTTTTTTANAHITTQNSTTTEPLASPEEASSMIKTNINKIAYEAEVKQMLLHSPNPQHDATQQQQQQQATQHHMQQQHQQHVMHMHQTMLHKSSPPPLSYDIHQKVEDTNKICYVNNQMQPYESTAQQAVAEECLITDPKFPPEGEVILGTDCCENEEEALVSSVGAEDNDEDEEDDDGFSLKMPSANCSENLSMDSEEPAVKESISKILDNLTNEECNETLNANNNTLDAQAEINCNMAGNSYMPQASDHQMPNGGESTEFYTPSVEETSALIAAQLAVENIKEKLQEKLEPQINDALTTQYLQNCAEQNVITQNEIIEQQEQELTTHNTPITNNNITLPALNPPPQPPTRPAKRISGPHLLYEIQSEDGFTYKSTSIAEVWEKVFEAVQVARRANGLAPLPEGPLADMSGVQMIGLKTNALKYLIEQLPGVEKCSKYTPKYHKRNDYASSANMGASSSSSSSMNGLSSAAATMDMDGNSIDYISDQEELNENPYESARCEPYSKRSEYDMFSWLASRHRKQPVQVFVQPSDNELVPRRGTGSNLPMAMKYRTLKETYKDYVGVFRSHIHGRGLYCTKDIEAGEMVIEYAGELIRSTLTDQRERYYNSRGIGCYMFKIDDHLVVDATMRGNAARFINHSCEPNCYSKVVDILGHKHIIIFALRRIVQGEELTYDYKFPFEDEKIPCSCGSKRCRKYLN